MPWNVDSRQLPDARAVPNRGVSSARCRGTSGNAASGLRRGKLVAPHAPPGTQRRRSAHPPTSAIGTGGKFLASRAAFLPPSRQSAAPPCDQPAGVTAGHQGGCPLSGRSARGHPAAKGLGFHWRSRYQYIAKVADSSPNQQASAKAKTKSSYSRDATLRWLSASCCTGKQTGQVFPALSQGLAVRLGSAGPVCCRRVSIDRPLASRTSSSAIVSSFSTRGRASSSWP